MLGRNLLWVREPGSGALRGGWGEATGGAKGVGGGLATCPNQSCPRLLHPRFHLPLWRVGLACSLAVLPAGPRGQHPGLVVLSGLSGERGGFWSRIQASVGFWLRLLRFGLPGQQPHAPKAAEPGLLRL